ncbi:MAG: hypothetical protein COW00_06470 [Bdellovibrio sp. CG12_big_fil_rev_8_21_14_0_65_39_13]|nr:MAG: hypothetical protein COW78_19005 [Bdellovibrio sp. CG22_combo_CG10-13_8_21_14_all_39_27]PIQ60865.1 MAG: hypothetical protein COW00_06470 [Bdellovibrio sp. CG12_big_fil_rev_8_21_14_0_65_39_13]PIR36489.1 MAG: hypothetical protein COV37_03815 [Bdellovibrio sp. CG11_big_fil_rev_8_21_14_0_20_39_38]PJB52905.1 MAG: hypothetical protein CO099_10145 [Bdellovibrio sp. CG_4_9_14_3_um_filter_39_7]
MVLSKKRLKLLILFLLYSTQAFSFTYDYVSSGSKVKWNSAIQSLVYHPSNSQGISSSSFASILENSLLQWNSVTPVSLSKSEGNGTLANGQNDVYFSNGSELAGGAGVLAVTQVAYKESTGEIIEADIAITDDYLHYPISTSAFGQNYLGDILTHEVGHFLGLGHSEVESSSMVFELGGGQNTISNDDILAVKNLYTSSPSTRITGKVVAKEYLPVFGTQVEFISKSTGKVLAGVISDASGNFSIEGIDEDIFVSLTPTKNSASLSSAYKYVRSDFCNSSTKYVKSFVQGCQKSNEGFPLKIRPSALSNRDLGNLSIRCNSGVPVDYMIGKGGTFDYDFLLNGNVVRNGFIGFFSSSELDNAGGDTIQIDLTSFTVPNSTTYLKLNLSSQEFYSPSVFTVKITDGLNNITNYTYQVSSDGKVTSDRSITLLLSYTNNLKNNFKIEITPSSLDQFISDHSSYKKSQIMPGITTLGESSTQYLLTSDIVNVAGSSILTEILPKYSDESLCLDGKVPFQAASLVNTSSKSSKTTKSDDPKMMACGSINTQEPPYNGPTAMFVGLILCLLIIPRKKLIS